MNLFGNKNALIGSIDLLIMGVLVLGSLVLRKTVANDLLDMDFSVIGSSVLGSIVYLLMDKLIHLSMRLSAGIGLLAFIAGGFLLAPLIGDGQADGSSK